MGLCMERSYEHDAWKEENGSSCRPNRRGEALLAAGTPERTLSWHQEILTLLLPASKGLNLSDCSGFLPSSLAPPPSYLPSLIFSFFPSFLPFHFPSFLSSSILPSLPSINIPGYLLSIYHRLLTFLQAGISTPTLGNLWDMLNKYLTNETRNASVKQCLL